MPKILLDMLTGIDGESYAIVKVIGFIVVFVFLWLEIAAFITGKSFDAQAYGLGAGAAITAMGVAIKLSETSEPKS